jgi:hypothetical protein
MDVALVPTYILLKNLVNDHIILRLSLMSLVTVPVGFQNLAINITVWARRVNFWNGSLFPHHRGTFKGHPKP